MSIKRLIFSDEIFKIYKIYFVIILGEEIKLNDFFK